MDERQKTANQLKVIVNEQNLSPECTIALKDAIGELERNCANCKFSSVFTFQRETKRQCHKALKPMPEDYHGYFVELNLEVEEDHFCTFHQPKDETK